MSISYPKWRNRDVFEVTDECAIVRDENYSELLYLCDAVAVSPSEDDRIVCNLMYEKDGVMLGEYGIYDNVLVYDDMGTLVFVDCGTMEWFVHTENKDFYEHFECESATKLQTGKYYHIKGKGFEYNPIYGSLVLSGSVAVSNCFIMMNEEALEYFRFKEDFERPELDALRAIEEYKTPYWMLVKSIEAAIVWMLSDCASLTPALEYIMNTYTFGVCTGRIESYYREEDPEYDEIKSIIK